MEMDADERDGMPVFFSVLAEKLEGHKGPQNTAVQISEYSRINMNK